MLIRYMLHDIAFKEKPKMVNAKKFKTVTTTIDDLIAAIEDGKSIRPGIIEDNGSSSQEWIEQQLIFIDVDDRTIKQSLDVCNQLNIKPMLMYKSFGYSEDKQKHRLVFRLDKPITDPMVIWKLNNKLIEAFKADSRCSNHSRIYYGTNHKAFNIDKEATIDLNVIAKIREVNRVAQTPHGFIKPSNSKASDINSCIKDPQLKNLIFIPKGISCGSFKTIYENLKGQTYGSYGDIARAFKRLDLAIFLGGHNIKCILPEHENDSKPSASIYQSKTGYYYYKCHACDNEPLDLYGLIATFYGFTGPNNYVFYKCTNVLIDAFDLKLSNDEWKKEQDRIIKANKIILKAFSAKTINHDYLKKYPKATKEFSKRISLLRSLTDEALIALEICPTKNRKGELLFNTSLRYIANDIGKDFSNVGKWIKFLCYLGFIKKIDHNTIKNTKMGQSVIQYSKQNKFSKVPQIYTIPEWTEDVFKKAEENYILFKQNGGTIKGATARQFNALGAKEVVIQENKETDQIKAIREAIIEYIRSHKQYCLLKELKSYGKKQGYSEKLIASFISEISKLEGIQYFRYTTKKIKKIYDLPESIHHSNAIFIIT